MELREIAVYDYTELSDSAKEKALSHHAEFVSGDSWYVDYIFEDAKEIGKLFGLEIKNIYFSGYNSQGDGACFEGYYEYRKGSLKSVQSFAPKDNELHQIVANLQELQRRNFYGLYTKVRHRGHYYHEMCTEFDTRHVSDQMSNDAEDGIAEFLRDFMRWIYKRLESEWEWQTSEECFLEDVEANGFKFYEDGEIAY